jgi:hypothetical protein
LIAITDLTFPDTANPALLFYELIYIAVAIALLIASSRVKSEWVRAGLSAFGLAILALRLLAVIPSWWLYFSDSHLHWGGTGCTAIDAQCIKQAVKDTAVVIENALVLGGFIVGFLIWQKRNPKQLAPGESKPEVTGGYK